MVEAHGADAVRYWSLSATLGSDYVYNEDDLRQGRRLCVKLWNAARFARRHLEGFDPARADAAAQPVDRWIRDRLAAVRDLATRRLDAYEFGLAKADIERFFWNDLCDNYLEMVKNRLYDESDEGAVARDAARAGLYDALHGVVRLLAPFVPHVSEAVYLDLFARREGKPSVAVAPWPTEAEYRRDAEAETAGTAAVALLTGVRRWRSEHKVSPGKPLASVALRAAPAVCEQARTVLADVKAAGRIETLRLEPAADLEADAVRVEAVEIGD
jgi:valyl-tRNA synthetase